MSATDMGKRFPGRMNGYHCFDPIIQVEVCVFGLRLLKIAIKYSNIQGQHPPSDVYNKCML